MGSALTLKVPRDFVLARDVCSYGYFILAPNHWNVRTRTLTRPFELAGGIATCTIAQPRAARWPADRSGVGTPLRIEVSRPLDRSEIAPVKRLIARMLNLDDPGVQAFHRVDPRWKKSGQARLFRSPTLFEDVIKTVTSCNVNWPGTVSMNRKLCAQFNPAFPTPQQLARRAPATLRARCGVGYRDTRIVALSKLFARGAVDPAWFEDPATSDVEVEKALLELPGIGPYAAANIMQLLGRYGFLALDTESVRHAKVVLGMTGTDAELHNKLRRHYERFGAHQFRSYWFELWDFYESVKGPAYTWDRETTGNDFTATKLNAALENMKGVQASARSRKKRAAHKGRARGGGGGAGRG